MQSVEGNGTILKRIFFHKKFYFLGEIVNFPKTVRPRGMVEQWLTSVEQAMYDAVKHHLKVS